MIRLTASQWTRVAAALAMVFTVLNAVNALNKGGDAAVFFEGGRRLLAAQPLYEGSSAADGFIGPPFQALFFAPFAAIAASVPSLAKFTWYFLNIACLGIGIVFATRAWTAARTTFGLPTPALPMVAFAPIAAVLLPLQTNFEHQNMNALLLALVSGAMYALTLGSPLAAGALVGAATALKAFPAAFILYFVARRAWKACAAAAIVAVTLTLLPIGIYGAAGFRALMETWIRLSRSGWPVRGNNQSLVAAIDRLTGAFGEAGVRTTADAPLAMSIFIAAALLLTALVAWVVLSGRHRASVPAEMSAVMALAILLTPIAWDHYWTLLFPSFLIVYYSAEPRLLGRSARPLFWVAALLTTGVSPLTLGRTGFDLARQLSANTLAALLLLVALLVLCWKMRAALRE